MLNLTWVDYKNLIQENRLFQAALPIAELYAPIRTIAWINRYRERASIASEAGRNAWERGDWHQTAEQYLRTAVAVTHLANIFFNNRCVLILATTCDITLQLHKARSLAKTGDKQKAYEELGEATNSLCYLTTILCSRVELIASYLLIQATKELALGIREGRKGRWLEACSHGIVSFARTSQAVPYGYLSLVAHQQTISSARASILQRARSFSAFCEANPLLEKLQVIPQRIIHLLSPPTAPSSLSRLDISIEDILSSGDRELIECRGILEGRAVTWAISSNALKGLIFSTEEAAKGSINLFDHWEDLCHQQTPSLGLITYENGIRTPVREFLEKCQVISHTTPKETLFIGLHNPTEGTFADILRLTVELFQQETPTIQKTREFMRLFAENIERSTPHITWGHLAHSEAALIAQRAFDGLSAHTQATIAKHTYFCAVGPALPIPAHIGLDNVNIYSERDFLGVFKYLVSTGNHDLIDQVFGKDHAKIIFTKKSSPWTQLNLFFFDHSMSGDTYTQVVRQQIEIWLEKFLNHPLLTSSLAIPLDVEESSPTQA